MSKQLVLHFDVVLDSSKKKVYSFLEEGPILSDCASLFREVFASEHPLRKKEKSSKKSPLVVFSSSIAIDREFPKDPEIYLYRDDGKENKAERNLAFNYIEELLKKVVIKNGKKKYLCSRNYILMGNTHVEGIYDCNIIYMGENTLVDYMEASTVKQMEGMSKIMKTYNVFIGSMGGNSFIDSLLRSSICDMEGDSKIRKASLGSVVGMLRDRAEVLERENVLLGKKYFLGLDD